MILIEELQHHGCQVEFLDRPMSQDPNDQLLVQIRGAVAEYERSLIAERLRRGRDRKYQAGILLPWSVPPYGYVVDPDHQRDPTGVALHEGRATLIQDIYARYLAPGGTLYGVTQHLCRSQIPSPTGKPLWSASTVRTILINPAYTGQVYIRRTRTVAAKSRRSATHPVGRTGVSRPPRPPKEWEPVARIPAIITPAQFQAVQDKLAQNRSFARRNNTRHEYLLRALISCGYCHAACCGRSGGTGYYTCGSKTEGKLRNQDHPCPARLIPATQIDTLVWEDLCHVLTQPEQILQAFRRFQEGNWLPDEWQTRRNQVRKGQRHLENQRDRLTEAYLQGIVPLGEYERRRREIEQHIEALAHQLEQFTTQANRQQALLTMSANIATFCQRIQQGLEHVTFAQKRQLVELLIDCVIIAGEEVEIRYVIPTSPQGELTRFCHLRLDYYIGVRVTLLPEAFR
jgi:site-specific DNA recombinase